MEREKRYVYKATLRSDYGLTDSMIHSLGEPDKTVPNPYYKSWSPGALYLIERVEAWVDAHQEELAEAARKRVARSASATAVADRKRAEAVAWAQTVPIEMAHLPRMRKLRIDADLYYMEKAMARGHYYGSGEPVNENGIIAFVRHNYTNYESILGQLFGLTGGGLAYQVIRQRVDKEIRLPLGLADASAAATGQEAGVPTPVAECDSTRQGGNRQ